MYVATKRKVTVWASPCAKHFWSYVTESLQPCCEWARSSSLFHLWENFGLKLPKITQFVSDRVWNGSMAPWSRDLLLPASLLVPSRKQTQSTQAVATLCKRGVDSLSPCFEFHVFSAFLKVINHSSTQLTLSLHPEKSHHGTTCSIAVFSCSGGCRVVTTSNGEEKKSSVGEWRVVSAGRGLEVGTLTSIVWSGKNSDEGAFK